MNNRSHGNFHGSPHRITMRWERLSPGEYKSDLGWHIFRDPQAKPDRRWLILPPSDLGSRQLARHHRRVFCKLAWAKEYAEYNHDILVYTASREFAASFLPEFDLDRKLQSAGYLDEGDC